MLTNSSNSRLDSPISRWQWCCIALAVAALAACTDGSADSVIEDRSGQRVVKLEVAAANVYIIEQGETTLMIDAGNPGDEKEYEQLMYDHDIDPASIDYLLLTHGHIDHAGTAAYFQKQYGVEIIGGIGDQPMISASGKTDLCPTNFLAKVIRKLGEGREYASFKLDHALNAGDGPFDLAKIGMTGAIYPSPGHTPGSVVALVGGQAFVGDLIRGGVLEPTRPQTHFFMCNLAENKQRIREVLDHSEVVQWNPGHMGPFAPDAVRAYLER